MLSNIQRRTYTDPSPNLPKAEEERILPMTFYKRNIILMPKSDRYHQNRKLQTNIFNERAAKISTSISKLNPKPHKKDQNHNQVEFIQSSQGWFNICTSVNGIHHINIIISIDVKEASDKIQHPFMIKILTKVGIEET